MEVNIFASESSQEGTKASQSKIKVVQMSYTLYINACFPKTMWIGLVESIILETQRSYFEQIRIIHYREQIMQKFVCRPLWTELYQNL